MMTIANRLRGTYGWFARVFAVVVTGLVYWFSGSWLVAGLIGVGYWFGEMICGWGNPMGTLTVHRWKKFKVFPEDGDAVGARWLTGVITHPRLLRLHLDNAKNGLYNVGPKVMNAEYKGWSLARLFRVELVQRPIQLFEIEDAIKWSRVFLVVRGVYWWTIPAIGVGLWFSSIMVGLAIVAVLSLSWPICAELGYLYSGKISVHKFGLDYDGGWELQEGFYGIAQDIVLVGLIVVYWIGV